MSKANESDELEISIPDLLSAIWELRLVIVALTIACAFAGALISANGGAVYETRASMLINARNPIGTYHDGSEYPSREDMMLAEDMAKTVELLASSDRVLMQVLEQALGQPLNDFTLLERLRESVRVSAEDYTAFLWLTIQWEDAQTAEKLLNCLMDTLPKVMLEVMDIGSVSIIDYARQVKYIPVKTSRNAGFGAMAGLIGGCALGVCYYLFVPKIRSNDMLEKMGLDIVGTIPFVAEVERKQSDLYLDDEKLTNHYREAFGRLAAVLRYQTEKENSRIIAVTSAINGEGKSTIAYNLALTFSQSGSKVLLLDFDFQKGILYQLAKSRKKKDGEVRTVPRDGEHLAQLIEQMYNGIFTIQGFSQESVLQCDNDVFPALRDLKKQFDYILIDTPPVGILSDIQQMRGLMDGVLLVVRQKKVTSGQVEEAVGFLEKTGIGILGCVVNG